MLKIALTLISAVYVSSASAQEQTREGAQAFLKQLGQEGALLFEFNGGKGYNVSTGEDWSKYGATEPTIRSYTYPPVQVTDSNKHVDECSSKFRFDGSSVADYNYKQGDVYFSHPLSWVTNITNPAVGSAGPTDLILWWNTMAEVRSSGRYVYVSKQFVDIRFTLPSENLAKRTAFAMEFLRVKCDKKSSTGF